MQDACTSWRKFSCCTVRRWVLAGSQDGGGSRLLLSVGVGGGSVPRLGLLRELRARASESIPELDTSPAKCGGCKGASLGHAAICQSPVTGCLFGVLRQGPHAHHLPLLQLLSIRHHHLS